MSSGDRDSSDISEQRLQAMRSSAGENFDEKPGFDEENGLVEAGEDAETVPQQDQHAEIEVPDGGYGWFVALAIFLFNFSTWGANAAYAIYYAHYLNYNVFPGTTKVEYGAVGGLTFGTGLIMAPVLNYIVGIVGIHPVIGVGIALQFAALMMASWAVSYWQLVLTQGMLLGVGMAAVAVPNVTLLPQWFRRKRSLAAGLGAAGSGLGGVTFSLGLQHVIQTKDYQWALRIEAIVCVAASLIALALTRTRARHIKPEFKVFDLQCFNFGFLMEVLWVFWLILGYVVLLYNLADFTISLGYSSHQSSIVSTMVSVGGFFFRPLVGQLSDRYGPITVNVYTHLLVALFAWAMWIPARNLVTAAMFALIEGGIMGSIWVVSPTITARIVGLRKMGICMGTLWVAIGISGIISPIIGIKLKKTSPDGGADPTQYLDSSIFVGCTYFASALSLFAMRGWIIARDELLLEMKEEKVLKEDTGEELLITVPPLLAFKKCFQYRTIKKT